MPGAVRLDPEQWGAMLPAAPILDRKVGGAVPALVRRWQGIAPDIDQLALDQHYLSIHLGGAKRLHRDGEGQRLVQDTGTVAHSIVPAGAAFEWRTEGPIDFMHVYLDPGAIDRFVITEFDREPAGAVLHDCLGQSDPLIAALSAALATELLSGAAAQQAYVDHLMHLLLFGLLRTHSDAVLPSQRGDHPLPPYKLRRAIEYIEAHLAEPIGVADIAAAVGTSAFHFSRAFRQATGRPPYAFLLERRIDLARGLMEETTLPLETIAGRCGFAGASHFSRMFRRATGISPSAYRNRLC